MLKPDRVDRTDVLRLGLVRRDGAFRRARVVPRGDPSSSWNRPLFRSMCGTVTLTGSCSLPSYLKDQPTLCRIHRSTTPRSVFALRALILSATAQTTPQADLRAHFQPCVSTRDHTDLSSRSRPSRRFSYRISSFSLAEDGFIFDRDHSFHAVKFW